MHEEVIAIMTVQKASATDRRPNFNNRKSKKGMPHCVTDRGSLESADAYPKYKVATLLLYVTVFTNTRP